MFFPYLAYAQQPHGWGEVASNLMEPVAILSNFVSTASLIVGISCFFAALLKYNQHRKNPLAAPIGTVILLLIIGIVLILLPFAYLITDSGIPFKLS